MIPLWLSQAIDELERDEVGQGALGRALVAESVSVMRREWARYHAAVGQWEVDDRGRGLATSNAEPTTDPTEAT